MRGLLALLSSSTSVNNCEKANNPIRTGKNANPCLNSSKPNVNLATPMIGEVFELNAIPKKSWWEKLRN